MEKSTMATQIAAQRITANFKKLVSSDSKIHNAYLLVQTGRSGLHINLAEGTTETEDGKRIPAHPDQPVFMASVGNVFTAVLVGILVENGKLSFDDRIVNHLDPDLLEGLHVYKGKDYTDQIRIKHLLNHTSGLQDYWEDKTDKGEGMIEQILKRPEQTWKPREIVAWSKENLKSHFPPGRGFHYSDTGYHLLGLSIESITQLPFHAALSRFIFDPLEMRHAFLVRHSEPLEENPHSIAGAYIGDTNVIHYPSLNVDYAGGGVTAPLEDMLKFMQSLVKWKLLQKKTFQRMDDCARFSIGIDYCYGMMKIKTVPLLMPSRFNCWGNAGSTGAFMFYHPGQDAYLIGCLNQFRYHAKGIRFMLRVIDTLIKHDK
jgi:D-alanyl-D-alanine carboxypeptidase